MKLSYIIGLVVVAVAMTIVIASADDASEYVDFATAQEMAAEGDDDKVHVVGELTKNTQGEIINIEYDPLKDPNFLAFMLKDDKAKVQRVICSNPPPNMSDFKRSEKVVIIGHYNTQNVFEAEEILLKCPSKYEEKELAMN
ncbi:MAG: cytochrome c maturation protein CcmE [Cytophagales bacterium]|nr:MAG: cytochrome c maturation protein CcmE [Cytophagales bacterium]TAF61937.1 MAG: cytochrome c maturation protein CcmE [Cytophagales bacterium]